MIFLKRKPQFKELLNQQGQAVVEYVLTLVITIAIIVGLLYQFSDAFQSFASNYFGEYIKCLIQEGELPQLKIKEADGIPSVCNSAFKDFSISDGRPPKPLKNNGRASGNNGNRSNSSSNRFKDGNPNINSSSSGGRGSSSTGRGGGNYGTGSSSGRSGDLNSSRNKKDSKKDRIVVAGSDSGPGFKGPNGSRSEQTLNNRRNRKNIVGRIEGPKKDNKKKKKVKANTSRVIDTDQNSQKKSFRMTASDPNTKVELPRDDWDFSDYFRYLIVAAIVLLLIFILGTSVMNAKNAQE